MTSYHRLDDIVKTKARLQERLVQMTSSYISKYMRTLFDSSASLKDFQTKLLEIADMDNDRIKKEKETAKFVKWCDKNGLGDPGDLLKRIVEFYVDSMLYKYSYTHSAGGSRGAIQKSVKLVKMFYKSLRTMSRHFYYAPKASKSDLSGYIHHVKRVVEDMMPFKMVSELIRENRSDSEQGFVPYNYSRGHESSIIEDSSSHHEDHHQNSKTQDRELRYISSDEIVNEYYQSESEIEREHLRASGQKEEKNVRHIEFKIKS